MLIRFWCDSDITFSCGLHTHLVTALYFSIINVLCGAGGDASFAPQANLVYITYKAFVCFGNLPANSLLPSQDIHCTVGQASMSSVGHRNAPLCGVMVMTINCSRFYRT